MASSRRSASNENVSTYGSAGLGRDYTSLQTWEAATDIDLVTAEQSEVLFVCRDEFPFDDDVELFGATTDENYFRIIRGAYAEGVLGIPTQMAYFSTSTDSECFRVREPYAQIQDISAECLQAAGTPSAFEVINATGAVIVGCVGKADSGSNTGIGFFTVAGGSDGPHQYINCMAYDCGSIGFSCGANVAVHAYNCTSYNNVEGFVRSSGTFTLINCLSDSNTTANYSGTFGGNSSHNASSDSAAPGGAGTRINQEFTYVDEINRDLHLAQDDIGARGHGLNLTADSVFPFDDDIDRELIVQWSIGWDSGGAFVSTETDCECEGSFTEVGVANGALAYLGVGLITEFSSATKQGALVQQLFAPLRRRLQQQYRWEFCLRRKVYTTGDEVSGVPLWGFTYAFLLPSDALQLWEVGHPHENQRYRLENKHILTNDSPIDILYSVEVADSNQWSASFMEALELKLASKLAMPLLHKPELLQLYEAMFQAKVDEAAFLNAVQSDDYSSYSSHLLTARYGFSLRDIPLDLS